jgi:hypothetical protein
LLPPLIVGTGGQGGATDKQQYPEVFFHTGPFKIIYHCVEMRHFLLGLSGYRAIFRIKNGSTRVETVVFCGLFHLIQRVGLVRAQ